MGQPYLRYYSSDEPKAGASASQLKLLESYEATSAEASHTFTISEDFNDISELLLIIDGTPTLDHALELILNTRTTGYYVASRRIQSAVETFIDISNASEMQISSIELNGTNTTYAGRVMIHLGKGATSDLIMADFIMASIGQEVGRGYQNTDTTSITSIKVQTSTSTWRVGTRMSLYKIQR